MNAVNGFPISMMIRHGSTVETPGMLIGPSEIEALPSVQFIGLP